MCNQLPGYLVVVPNEQRPEFLNVLNAEEEGGRGAIDFRAICNDNLGTGVRNIHCNFCSVSTGAWVVHGL